MSSVVSVRCTRQVLCPMGMSSVHRCQVCGVSSGECGVCMVVMSQWCVVRCVVVSKCVVSVWSGLRETLKWFTRDIEFRVSGGAGREGKGGGKGREGEPTEDRPREQGKVWGGG